MIVPPGALTHDQRVTITPVSTVGGLPLTGGLVAAVQVGDDSLQLAKPAQLVIRRDGLAPAPSQVAFGWHNGGEDLFAHFSEIQGSGFKTLKENQKVEFEVKDGPKGKQAVQIRAIG